MPPSNASTPEPLAREPSPQPGPLEPAAPERLGNSSWTNKHPINIRLSVPFLFWRFYLTIIAGKERRDSDRRKAERGQHPLIKPGNVVFLGYAGLIALLAFGGALGVLLVVLIRHFFDAELILQ